MGIVFLPRTHHNNWGTQGLVQCPAPTSCVWCSGWPGAPSLLLVAAPNSPGWPSAPSLLLVAAPNSPGWPGAPSLLLVAAPNSPGWPGAPSLLWWRPPISLEEPLLSLPLSLWQRVSRSKPGYQGTIGPWLQQWLRDGHVTHARVMRLSSGHLTAQSGKRLLSSLQRLTGRPSHRDLRRRKRRSKQRSEQERRAKSHDVVWIPGSSILDIT